MTVSLPEERALLGQGQAAGVEPVSLDPDDNDLSKYSEQAQSILDRGGFFTNQDLHTLVARLVLGA